MRKMNTKDSRTYNFILIIKYRYMVYHTDIYMYVYIYLYRVKHLYLALNYLMYKCYFADKSERELLIL